MNSTPTTRLPISVCIISGNEAHRITPTLQSVAAWASEIIVVLNDTVNDGTDKIVESFGGKVFREPWGGFVQQKNFAADKCTQDWLLNLDADEVISLELAEEIKNLFTVSGESQNHVAYDFPRCTLFYGRWIRHGEWYPDRNLRLWRRGRGSWGGVEPHARVVITGDQIGHFTGELMHYSMESIDHMLGKGMKYSDDFAAQCQKTGRRVTVTDLFVRPPWRFLRGYVFKLGFLDGWRGLTIAWMAAFYTFLRYLKAYEQQNRQPPAS